MKIFNLSDVEDVQWKFNGLVVTPGKDLYYKVPASGTLEATASLSDGSEMVLIKEIRVSDN